MFRLDEIFSLVCESNIKSVISPIWNKIFVRCYRELLLMTVISIALTHHAVGFVSCLLNNYLLNYFVLIIL